MVKRSVFLLVMLMLFQSLFGRSARVGQIPNGSVFGCKSCHTGNGGPRNAFGLDIQNGFLSQAGSGGTVVWGVDLAQLDSDGDASTNGLELQDPEGAWKIGSSNPGKSQDVTNPGDAESMPTTGIPDPSKLPAAWSLSENYPNPFNGITRIFYNLPANGAVQIGIYDVQGRRVQTLVREHLSSGMFHYEWNGTDSAGQEVQSGVYLCVMSFEGQIRQQKIIYLK